MYTVINNDKEQTMDDNPTLLITLNDFNGLLAAYDEAAETVWNMDISQLTAVIMELEKEIVAIKDRVKYLNEGMVEL
jgi:hypothetical protein